MILVNVTLSSTGRYRCEVSTEAPMFSTESKYGDLLVVILPSNPPVIMGGQHEYSPGDFVHLNCSSHDSKPAADLTWRINGQKVKIYLQLCQPFSLFLLHWVVPELPIQISA